MPYFDVYPLKKSPVRTIDAANMAKYDMSEEAAIEIALTRSRITNYAIAVAEIFPVVDEKQGYERTIRYLVHREIIFSSQSEANRQIV